MSLPGYVFAWCILLGHLLLLTTFPTWPFALSADGKRPAFNDWRPSYAVRRPQPPPQPAKTVCLRGLGAPSPRAGRGRR